MSRYIRDVELGQPIDVVSMIMEDFVYHNHFSRTDWNGEMVYYFKDDHKKERYLKWSYIGGVFHVEAWIKNAFGGEMDLDGVGGGASRKEFRRSLDSLEGTLKRQSAASISNGHVGGDPLHHGGSHGSESGGRQAQRQTQGSSRQTGYGAQGNAGSQTGHGFQSTAGRQTGHDSQGGSQDSPIQQIIRQIVSLFGDFASTEDGRLSPMGIILIILALLFGCSFPVFGLILAAYVLRQTNDSDGRWKTVGHLILIGALVIFLVQVLMLIYGYF